MPAAPLRPGVGVQPSAPATEKHPISLTAPVVGSRSNDATDPGVFAATYTDVPSGLTATACASDSPMPSAQPPAWEVAMQPWGLRSPVAARACPVVSDRAAAK